jgi:transposase
MIKSCSRVKKRSHLSAAKGGSAMTNLTIGMDLGNKKNEVCVLNEEGEIQVRKTIPNNKLSIQAFFSDYQEATVIVENGTHSPWISRLLEEEMKCNVIVGNARKLRMIWTNPRKSDMQDAEMLARIGRFDKSLLYPIKHRSQEAQGDLAIIKARDVLVKSRSQLINHMRGAIKAMGGFLPTCSSASFYEKVEEFIPEILKPALDPILKSIEELTKKIKAYDYTIKNLNDEKYPETKIISQIQGIGPITSLAFILTIEEKERFEKSRDVGAYLGLTPKKDQSGEMDKQLHITKTGNNYMRRLLVGCAHYVLGPFGKTNEIRVYGERIAARGGKNAKRRAIVAVARKLAVLMHRLWTTGEVYDPYYNRKIKHAA